MISGRIAYGNARVRALKSQLFDVDMGRQLRRDGTRGGTTAGGRGLPDERFRHLLRCYAVLIRSYPTGLTLFRALVRLHEVENLKLVWRAHVRKHRFEQWKDLWRPLDSLETVRLQSCRDRTSLSEVVDSLRTTPYAGIARTIIRAHPNDLAAAEIAFDRWASDAIAAAAAALGGTEATARDLALSIVRERDLNLLRRGVRAYELSPDAVVGSLVVLPRELPPTSSRGSPHGLARRAPSSGRGRGPGTHERTFPPTGMRSCSRSDGAVVRRAAARFSARHSAWLLRSLCCSSRKRRCAASRRSRNPPAVRATMCCSSACWRRAQ